MLDRYPKSDRWQEACAWTAVLTTLIQQENEAIYLNDKVKLIQSTLQSHKQKIESLSEINRILRTQRAHQEEPQQTQQTQPVQEVEPHEKQIEALQSEVRELQELIERMKQIDIQIEEEKRKVVPK